MHRLCVLYVHNVFYRDTIYFVARVWPSNRIETLPTTSTLATINPTFHDACSATHVTFHRTDPRQVYVCFASSCSRDVVLFADNMHDTYVKALQFVSS